MTDASKFPVMPRQCSTCPFRVDERGRHPDAELMGKIQQRCLSEASQICHHPRLQGKPETHLCRGARDFQIQVFYRIGFLDAPTDEAWQQKWEQMQSGETINNS